MTNRPSRDLASKFEPGTTPVPCKTPSTCWEPVVAMGLVFPNAVGLAAGFDRTGERVPSLFASGFGHIEIGTFNSTSLYPGSARRIIGGPRLGINIGSLRRGLDDLVIEDFLQRLRQAAPIADYAVANLTAPNMLRNGNSSGVTKLLEHLGRVRDELSNVSARRLPVLVKLDAGDEGDPIPAAIIAARLHDLDGIVLVSDRIGRLQEISSHIDSLTIISVGGIRTATDVRARLASGATLVQVHRAFAEGGENQIRRILEDI